MKLVGVIVVVGACVAPAQQQQTQPQYAQPQPQYAQPQPYAAQPAPMASCQDTLGCYSQCNPMTQECMTACDQRTSPESQQNAHAVIQCMASSGCQDNNCVAQRCNAQVQACTNVTLAVQQPSAPASQPSTGPLTVGPPTRQLTVADLQGAWQHDDQIMKSYVSASTGTYAGYSVIADTEHWLIDAQGQMTDNYAGTHAGVGGTFQVNSTHAETITISGNVFVRTPAKGDGIPRYYLIRGWEVRPDITVIKLHGPAYQLDQFNDRDRNDPNYGGNIDEYWVRINKQ